MSTASGGSLIITGGNNTGGFAQAPAIARAVWKGLVGERDPIHVLFHPDRGKLPTSTTHTSQSVEPSVPRGIEASRAPPRLLLLCSDGAQHRYLRYRLDQAFPGYRCIVETSEGQARHLVGQGHMFDAAYMYYHSLRRYLLGYDRQRSAYFERMVPPDYTSPSPDLKVDTLNCSRVWEAVEIWLPDLTVVSGAKYIGRNLNKRAGLMINMHVGHLPEYKGNHCIFFAMYDGEINKIAATLHQLTPRLDGGDILDIVSPPILPSDNEEALYTRCIHAVMDRCLEHIEQFARGQKLAFIAQKKVGRMFRHRDRTPWKEMLLWWNTAVGGLLRNYSTVHKVM